MALPLVFGGGLEYPKILLGSPSAPRCVKVSMHLRHFHDLLFNMFSQYEGRGPLTFLALLTVGTSKAFDPKNFLHGVTYTFYGDYRKLVCLFPLNLFVNSYYITLLIVKRFQLFIISLKTSKDTITSQDSVSLG